MTGESPPSARRPYPRLDRFELAGIATSLIVLLAILLTVAGGDRVGVGLVQHSPDAESRSLTPLQLTFSETMDTESVRVHLRITPDMPGVTTWNGPQMTFRPARTWQAGTYYQIRVEIGAQAISGRRVAEALAFGFLAQPAQVLFLAPAGNEDVPANLWIADTGAPEMARQITFSATGVTEYRASPDGSRLVYVQGEARGATDLYTVEIASGTVRRLTNCEAVQAMCGMPSWSPDGSRIAYERRELSADVPEADRQKPRTWIVNLRDLSTAPLLSNALQLGAAPVWSPDGMRIAVYDLNQGGIVLYSLSDGSALLVSTLEGDSGLYTFSPDGTRLVYPVLRLMPGRFTTELSLVDLAQPARGILSLSGPDNPSVEDSQPAWHPDGVSLAITRRWMDGSGSLYAQIYRLDPERAALSPLVVDESYIHGAISWSPAGDALLYQRFSPSEGSAPEIWLLDVPSDTRRLIARNGFLPRWLP